MCSRNQEVNDHNKTEGGILGHFLDRDCRRRQLCCIKEHSCPYFAFSQAHDIISAFFFSLDAALWLVYQSLVSKYCLGHRNYKLQFYYTCLHRTNIGPMPLTTYIRRAFLSQDPTFRRRMRIQHSVCVNVITK